MNKGSAVDIVAYRVGNRTDLDTRIAQEMQLVQETDLELWTDLPWFLLSENQSISTTAAESRIPLPTGFLREYEFGALWVYDSSLTIPWVKLKKTTEDWALANLGDTIDATGKPTHYTLTESYFRLYPVPDAAYTIKTKVYASDTDLTTLSDTETNLWLTHAPDVLIAGTTVSMADQLQMKDDKYKRFDMAYKKALTRLRTDIQARRSANLRATMGTGLTHS